MRTEDRCKSFMQVVERKAGGGLQLKPEIDGNRGSRPVRCETNWEEAESKERRFRNS